MDDRIRTALWALGGLALAVVISLGAFAVAGGRISEPAGSVRVSPTADEQQPEHAPAPSGTAKPSKSGSPSGGGTSTETSTVTATSTSTVTAEPSPSHDHGGAHDGTDD
jgi:hypothetical protein